MEDKKTPEELNDELKDQDKETNKEEKKEEGSGIFTVDGKELPKVEGGYSFHGPGGTLGDNRLK
jgi:hypothetical protein